MLHILSQKITVRKQVAQLQQLADQLGNTARS